MKKINISMRGIPTKEREITKYKVFCNDSEGFLGAQNIIGDAFRDFSLSENNYWYIDEKQTTEEPLFYASSRPELRNLITDYIFEGLLPNPVEAMTNEELCESGVYGTEQYAEEVKHAEKFRRAPSRIDMSSDNTKSEEDRKKFCIGVASDGTLILKKNN